MSKPTKSSLFIVSPSVELGGFYQQLLRRTGSYEQLGNLLVQLGEQAHAVREFDKVREIGLLLSNTPLKRYRAIGYYFLAVAANSVGNGDQDEARRLFELVVDTAPDIYKRKAILSLGALARHRGEVDSALYLYRETVKSEGLGLSGLQAMRGFAVLKSAEGFHESAVKDLEVILPIIRFAPLNIYLDFLNSYAVDLSAVGRLHEATNVSSLVVASPLSARYPEWRETLSEIRSKQKRRSTVAISRPEIEREFEAEPEIIEDALQAARIQTVIDFMSANLHRAVTLPELAEIVHLSASRFSDIFKIQTGLSPIAYLIKLRMERAHELLITRFESIKEIMAMVGYSDRANFLRHFRRYFELTPSEYRKRGFTRA